MLLAGFGYGCTGETGFEKESRDGLTFEVTTAKWQSGVFAQTKSTEEEGIPVTLTDITDEKGEVVYMMEAMEGVPVQPANTLGKKGDAATKATEKTTWADAEQFGLRAYASGNDYDSEFDYFGTNKSATYHTSTGTWDMSENLYWPTSRNLVKFYAWWPYDAGNVQPEFDGNDKFLTYTVPTDPTQQQDLLYATTNQLNVIGSHGVVPLQFKHALTAVVFKGADAELNISIKKITLKNVWCKGEFNMDSESWMADKSDPSNKKIISFNAYHEYRGYYVSPYEDQNGWYYKNNEGDAWTLEEDAVERKTPVLNDNGNLLMLMPQDMIDADGTTRRKVEFTLTDDRTIEIDLPQTPAWTPGATVIYTLQKGGKLAFISGGSYNQTTSQPDPFVYSRKLIDAWRYKNNTDGTFVKVRSKWKVTRIRRYIVNSSPATLEPESVAIIPNGDPIDSASTYGIYGFLPSGVDYAHAKNLNTWNSAVCEEYGGINAYSWAGTVGYPAPVQKVESRYSTKEVIDAALREKAVVGSSSEYHDLSATATANCYIVEAPGYYKFKAVKGNNFNNEPPQNLNLTDATFSYVADNANIIDDTVLPDPISLEGGYVKFKTKESPDLEHGNVIITASNGGTTLWQWHIWVTDSANWHPAEERTIHSSVGGATTNYIFHPVSLGLGYTGYHADHNEYRIRLDVAVTDDDYNLLTGRWASSDHITLLRNPSSIEEGYYYATYKWGDAVPRSLVGHGGSPINGVGRFPVPAFSNPSPVSHPLEYDTWNASANFDGPYTATYGVTKTIYDPSPAGWHVPPPQATNNLGTTDHTLGNVHGYDFQSGYSTDYLYVFNKHQDGTAVSGGIAFWFKNDWIYWSCGTSDSGSVVNAYSSTKTSAETWGPTATSADTEGLVRPVKD